MSFCDDPCWNEWATFRWKGCHLLTGISGNIHWNTHFAAKESETLCSIGKKQRTFNYHGVEYLMEKHLKIIGGFSDALSLRIHFAWIPDEKLILIGHCGKHLKL